jgi:hypothetical protein
LRIDGVTSRLEYDRGVVDLSDMQTPARFVLQFDFTASRFELAELEQVLTEGGLAGPLDLLERLYTAMSGVPGVQRVSKAEEET